MEANGTIQAIPILKWAGGKSSLIEQYKKYFPKSARTYYEPFAGSAAIFFHLRSQGFAQHYQISDMNEELIILYRTVQKNPDALIEQLRIHKENHGKKYYYQVREMDREGIEGYSDVDRAARMVYLNRTCFNGLWRVNSKGQFNVPMGRYKNPAILDEDRLRAASAALQDVTIKVADFKSAVQGAEAGDFVYFDPPYVPVNLTSNFTSYFADGFGMDQQEALAEAVRQLADRGVRVMVSNSDAPLVHELYDGFRIERVQAQRRINRDAGKRGHINEVLVLAG